MPSVSFTVDVDRDVNAALQGSHEAVCSKGDVRFTSSYKGLLIFVDVLNELGIKGTFFIEGKTAEVFGELCDIKSLMKGHEIGCHGYNHEDLTGTDSKKLMTDEEMEKIIVKGKDAVENVFGIITKGFRAPYLHYDERVESIISKTGFTYSSSTVKSDEECHATVHNNLVEIPVLRTKDRNSKWMQSYLWPLHEGKRSSDDYKYMISKDPELLVFGDHSWHMVENYSQNFSEDRIKQNKEELKDILSYALDKHEFITLAECAKQFS